MYFTSTKDFKEFSRAKVFLDPGFSVIDAVIVKRKKADYVLVLKDNTRPERNLKVAFANSALGPFTDISPAFTASFTEGPSVVKVKDDWLIYYDSYREKIYAAASTKDFKHFEDITTWVSIPTGHKHGTIIKVKKRVLDNLLRNYRPEALWGKRIH
jgi:hypothetical protein